MPIATFAVQARSRNAGQVDTHFRGHQLLVGEPPEGVASESAPYPVELLLAGYAGCLNNTLYILAGERKIQLNGLQINVRGSINLDRMYGQNQTVRAGYDKLIVEVQVDSPAAQSELDRLLTDAKYRCPVTDNLVHETLLEYQLQRVTSTATA